MFLYIPQDLLSEKGMNNVDTESFSNDVTPGKSTKGDILDACASDIAPPEGGECYHVAKKMKPSALQERGDGDVPSCKACRDEISEGALPTPVDVSGERNDVHAEDEQLLSQFTALSVKIKKHLATSILRHHQTFALVLVSEVNAMINTWSKLSSVSSVLSLLKGVLALELWNISEQLLLAVCKVLCDGEIKGTSEENGSASASPIHPLSVMCILVTVLLVRIRSTKQPCSRVVSKAIEMCMRSTDLLPLSEVSLQQMCVDLVISRMVCKCSMLQVTSPPVPPPAVELGKYSVNSNGNSIVSGHSAVKSNTINVSRDNSSEIGRCIELEYCVWTPFPHQLELYQRIVRQVYSYFLS